MRRWTFKTSTPSPSPAVAVIGGGPAGLMAAEVLSAKGVSVVVYDRMPTFGRKFLMAGRGGLNLTHSEPFEAFVRRYGGAAERLRPMLQSFPPQALIDWAQGLGQPTFVGSSGRVFPKTLKASPLLRAWLARLASAHVDLRPNYEWLGWNDDGALKLRPAGGGVDVLCPHFTILALGGASWPKLGSNGAWGPILAAAGVPLTPFRPANAGFLVAWTDVFRNRFAGAPLKTVAVTFDGVTARGEAMITRSGLEGGVIYALGARLRDALALDGAADIAIDIRPDLTEAALAERLSKPRGGDSLSNHLRKSGLTPLAISLLREAHGRALPVQPAALAALIKAAPIRVMGAAPLDRAISTAGGVALSAVADDLMLKSRPGVFVAGEMLDWEAPTGGYLLQACFASGVAAAQGVLARLRP